MPVTPLLVTGKVYDNNSTELVGALVTAVNTTTNSSTIRALTTSSGYVLDIANCGYSVGDTIKLVASYEGWGYLTYTFTAGSSFTHDFTLDEEEPSFGYQYQGRYQMKKAIITSFDGEDIKHSNPFPVEIVLSNSGEIDLANNPSKVYAYNSDKLVTTITITLVNGNVYVKTYTYNADMMVTAESKWVKQ